MIVAWMRDTCQPNLADHLVWVNHPDLHVRSETNSALGNGIDSWLDE
jgi:hypothetical protein